MKIRRRRANRSPLLRRVLTGARVPALATAAALWFAAPALADDAGTPPDAVETAPTEVEAENYDEITNVRVLERTLMPTEQARVEQLEMGLGVDAPDRLSMTGEAPVDLLLRGAGAPGDGSLRTDDSLQVTLDHSLGAALKQIQIDLEPYLEDGGPQLQKPFGLDVASQPAVQKYLALWTDRGSTTIKTWLKRSERWKPMIFEILDAEGVPRDLLYLAMIESGYRNTVKSPANAGGMWQFVPGTAVDMGLRIDAFVDERQDPVKATRAGARYLRKQYDRFGSWPLAMAAYNGGAGTVSTGIKTYNSNDYFKLVEYGAMYEETRRYVPRIMAAALIGKNREAFGFAGLQGDSVFAFDEVDVPGEVRLTLFAEAAGTNLETLEELNPELLKAQTPPGDTYTLRIPAGSRDTFVANYDRLAETYGESHETHVVRFGESMDHIAAESGVPVRVLRAVNGIGKRERAPYGSEVIVPTGFKGSGSTAEKKSDEPPVVLVPKLSSDFRFDDRARFFYEVNSGDTLDEIAEHFGLRRVEIALWNDLDPAAKLRSSLTLQLFLPRDFDASSAVLLADADVNAVVIGSDEYAKLSGKKGKKSGQRAVSYKVKRGDSVSRIAKKHGVSSKDIIKWNNLDKKATIRPGMRLVIHK